MNKDYIIKEAERAFELAIEYCESRKDYWFEKWYTARKAENTIMMDMCETKMQLLNKLENTYCNILIEEYDRTEYDYESEKEYDYDDDDEYEEFDEN